MLIMVLMAYSLVMRPERFNKWLQGGQIHFNKGRIMGRVKRKKSLLDVDQQQRIEDINKGNIPELFASECTDEKALAALKAKYVKKPTATNEVKEFWKKQGFTQRDETISPKEKSILDAIDEQVLEYRNWMDSLSNVSMHARSKYDKIKAWELDIRKAITIAILPKKGKNQQWPMIVYWWILREKKPSNPLYISKGKTVIGAVKRFLDSFEKEINIARPGMDFKTETENLCRYVRDIKPGDMDLFYQQIELMNKACQQNAFDAILHYKRLFRVKSG